MADFVCGIWEFDFSKMTATDCTNRMHGYQLTVIDGKLHWFWTDGMGVYEMPPTVQEAYSEWLDKQIYGEAHG